MAGENNTIVDCFSRLTREIKEAQHYSLCDTIKLSDKSAAQSKAGVKTGFSVKAIRNSKKPTEDDPWVEYLGEVAMTDSDYITMVHHLEAGTEINDRIFWEAMNKEAKELIRTCEQCQIIARSHKKDKTEISYKNLASEDMDGPCLSFYLTFYINMCILACLHTCKLS